MRRAVWTAVILLVAACSSAPVQSNLGDDGWGPSHDDAAPPRKRPVAPRALPIPEGKRQPYARASEIANLKEIPGRSQSEHLDGVFDRSVWVSEQAAGYLALTPGTVMAPGALIVQRHHPRGSDRTVAYFVMEKLAQGSQSETRDWRFLVLDDELRVAAEKNLQLCGRCHADAPYNGLFGIAEDP